MNQASFGYTRGYFDTYIKLIYLRSRLYDPATGRFTTKDSWQGDYNRPLSLNRWNYVEGNPVNHTDPSGYITDTESGRANDIVKKLKIYHVYVKVDWGMVYSQSSYINQPYAPFSTCVWKDGEWQLKELENIRKGVVDLSRAMGLNNFIFNLGHVNVVKGKLDPGYAATGGKHILTVNIARHDIGVWGTVHELGHAWDYKYGNQLSKGLVEITTQYEPRTKPAICDQGNRLPGCNTKGYVYGGIPAAGSDENFTELEDFAESVAAYVYPEDAQGKVQKYQKLSNGVNYKDYLYYSDYRTTLRWQYIDALIHSTNNSRPR